MNPHLAFLLGPVYEGNLHPAHRADLAKSGIQEPTRQAQGIRSVPPSMIPQLLGFDPRGVTSALLFPFPDPAGGFMDHVRVKVFPPLTDAEGHAIKYLQPRGSGVRLYFARVCLPEALEGTDELWLVEGEKKCLAIAQLGMPAIGLCGIEGWHPRGSRDLLPDFDHIRLENRVVELLPDGDWRTNPDVARGVARLHEALTRRGARSRLVALPEAVEAAR
jgi:uncharacterized protein DUF3854